MNWKMRTTVLLITLCFSCSKLWAQVGINADNSTPAPSAMLDVQSPDKGVLVPRMDSTGRQNIVNPADGLMVYDSTFGTFWYYENLRWNEIRNGSNRISVTDLLGMPPTPDLRCLEIISGLPLGPVPEYLAVAGNYAYVVDIGSLDLRVIDVSDPRTPIAVGSLPLGTNPRSIAIANNYAYVLDGDDRDLKVIDVSDPSTPNLVVSRMIGSRPADIVVLGNYAYVTDTEDDDLKVINISDPSNPLVVGSLDLGNFPTDLSVVGNYAYVIDVGSDDLKVIDVSDPSNPIELGSIVFGESPRLDSPPRTHSFPQQR
ncbi:MAG: hypothetical protein AAFU67_06690 [Bacteroidota bacterium]